MNNIENLNKQFALNGSAHELTFKMGEGDIPVVEVKNEFATAVISLQGAHVISWIPAGEHEVIWVSEDATFAVGKSLRGGVPICWPWFGPHESNKDFPAHGFARTVMWTPAGTEQLSTGETQVTFKLDMKTLEDKYQAMWPQATVAEYKITVGKKLQFDLITTNNSDQPITIGQALHTYFSVDDVSKTTIAGLDGKDYLDKTDGFKRKTQAGNVVIGQEVDRIYLDTPDTTVIDDTKRKIVISKQGSASTVVWNPWEAAANKMGDLGKDGYLKMLCVESANAADDTVSIAPNNSHTLHVTYELE